MSETDKDTKQRIINATIDLLRTVASEKITMRRIAKQANVTLSSLNYYFQTKENLLNVAVQVTIGGLIPGWYAKYNALKEKDPRTKFRIMIKGTGKYLASNPKISRISITNDLLNGNDTDNTMQTSLAYLTALKEIYGDQKSEQELKLLFHMIISAGQSAFLRADIFKKYTGIDFSDDAQRDSFLDFMVNTLIQVKGEDHD